MIGSHNTLTYMKPLKWWMRLFTPIAKCQSKDIEKQKVDLADIRIRYVNGTWYVSHGIVLYCFLHTGLTFIVCKGMINHVRILIEGKYNDKAIQDLTNTIKLWHQYFERFGVKFYTCRTKKGWKKLVDVPDLEVKQEVGSMKSWYGKLCPWLWWVLHKPEVSNAGEGHILYDFV